MNNSKLIFNLTVDWEGEHFRNLHDLVSVRKKIGAEVPVTHFICPAYFTNELKNASQKIKSAIFENDEIALHVHCYESLVKKAGVKFRTEPDFYPQNRSLPKFLRKKNTGRGVPLSAYNYDEILKILTISIQLLQENLKVEKIYGFRAGGWIANDDIFRALQELGFEYDSSATPPEIMSQGFSLKNDGNFADEYGDVNQTFSEFVVKMWGHKIAEEPFLKNSLYRKFCPDTYIKKTTQPFKIQNITELPNNASMTDYATFEQSLCPTLTQLIELAKHSGKNLFYNVGIHHEGDLAFKLPILKLLNSITEKDREFIKFQSCR